MPKIGNCNILGRPFHQVRPQCTQITPINMYLLNAVKHIIPIQCYANYIEVKHIQVNMFDVDIFKIPQKRIGYPDQ